MKYVRFSGAYFILALILFGIEVWIGLFVHDSIIRPYGGDFLVVVLIYCFVRSFLNTPAVPTAAAVLLFSWAVEISQYFHLIHRIDLENSRTARLLLGTSFSFTDIAAYTLGLLLTVIIERVKLNFNNFNDRYIRR